MRSGFCDKSFVKMRAYFFTGFISCCIAVGVTLAVLYTQFYDKTDVDSIIESSYSSPNLYRAFQNTF